MTTTGGNVVVEEINVGDIHYEYECGILLKVKVVTLPTKKNGVWTWQSKALSNGKKIDYLVTEGLSHYAPKLYDYIPYENCKII